MFSRVASFSVLALSLLAVATPAAADATTACCDSTIPVSPASLFVYQLILEC